MPKSTFARLILSNSRRVLSMLRPSFWWRNGGDLDGRLTYYLTKVRFHETHFAKRETYEAQLKNAVQGAGAVEAKYNAVIGAALLVKVKSRRRKLLKSGGGKSTFIRSLVTRFFAKILF